jgi:hypothetical protein
MGGSGAASGGAVHAAGTPGSYSLAAAVALAAQDVHRWSWAANVFTEQLALQGTYGHRLWGLAELSDGFCTASVLLVYVVRVLA